MAKRENTNIIDRAVKSISRGFGIIAIFILVLMMLFTVTDVILRKIFNTPIPGGLELIEFMMIFTGFLGLAWCALSGMHIRVDLVVSKMSRRTQGIIDSLCHFTGISMSIIIAWRSILEGLATRQLHTESAVLAIPIFPFYFVLATGFAVLGLSILILLLRALKEAFKG